MGGAYDAGFGDINAIIQNAAANPGQQPIMVYQMWNQPPFAIVARNPAGIKSIKDFEGKTLGGAQGTPTTRLMPVFASVNKLDLSKIKFTNMAPNLQEPMLIQGHMDAAMVFNITSYFNLVGLNQDPDKDYTWFSFADYGMDLYSNGMMVSQKLMRENPKAVAGLVRAVNQATLEVGRDIPGAMASVRRFDALVDANVETRRLKFAYEKLMVSGESKGFAVFGEGRAPAVVHPDQVAAVAADAVVEIVGDAVDEMGGQRLEALRQVFGVDAALEYLARVRKIGAAAEHVFRAAVPGDRVGREVPRVGGIARRVERGCRKIASRARHHATRRKAADSISAIRSICGFSTISGGDRATMSPVVRISRPASKQSTSTS
jgi:ABC-type amino acid transport substrate-binding protein